MKKEFPSNGGVLRSGWVVVQQRGLSRETDISVLSMEDFHAIAASKGGFHSGKIAQISLGQLSCKTCEVEI